MEELIREAIFKSLKETKKEIQRPKTANIWKEEGESRREGERKEEGGGGGERREDRGGREGKKKKEIVVGKKEDEVGQKEEGGRGGKREGGTVEGRGKREEEGGRREEGTKEDGEKRKEGGETKEEGVGRTNSKRKFLSLSDEVEDLRRIGEFLNNPKATELECFMREINEIILFLVKLVEFTKSHEIGLKFLKKIPNFLGGQEKVMEESFGKILALYHVNLNVIFSY